MNMAIVARNAESARFAKLLATLREIKVYDLTTAEPESDDVLDFSTRHLRVLQAVIEYFETEGRALNWYADCKLDTKGIRDVLEAAWSEVIKPEFDEAENLVRDTEEFRTSYEEHRTYRVIGGHVA